MQTEEKLRTLPQQMEDNRSQGRKLYQELDHASTEECKSVIDKTHAAELRFLAQVWRHLYHVIVNSFELRYIALLGISIQTQIGTTTGVDVSIYASPDVQHRAQARHQYTVPLDTVNAE